MSPMTSRDENRIIEWNERRPETAEIRLIRTGDSRSDELAGFCEELARLAPTVQIRREKADGEDHPAIEVAPGLRYQAVPLGLELPPFLDALGRNIPAVSEDVQTDLKAIPVPVDFRLYVAQTCPHCPQIIRQLLPVILAGDRINLTIVDGSLFTDMAEADRIQAVPTLIMDDGTRWTGSLKLAEILDVVVRRDPKSLSSASMERIIKEGKAADLAGMMIDAGDIFPAFVDLLTHEKWPVRLGAMVTVETLAEADHALAERLVSLLWERFPAAEDTVRGDLLYVIGEAGTPAETDRLRAVAGGDYPDEVREAAREAMENINQPEDS